MNKFIHKELYRMLVGQRLGQGMHRTVYAHRLDPTLVIKVETEGRCFSNVLEHEMWKDVQFMPKLAKWFAPVVEISPCGSVLLQRRAIPIRAEELPKMIPTVFTDLKLSNWGMLDGHPVCVDYGCTISSLSNKMKKANWHPNE